MSKSSSAIAGLVVVVSLTALAAVPIGRLLLLYASLGFPALVVLMFAEAAISIARSLSPLRSNSWWKRTDSEAPRFVHKVIGLELGVSAFAMALVAGTAPLWQPHVAIVLPLWLLVLVGLRSAATMIMLTLGLFRGPLAGLIGMFDMAVAVPLFALITRSVGGALVGATILSLLLTWVAMHVPTKDDIEKATGKKWKAADSEIRTSSDRWMVGGYLNILAGSIRRPLLVALAGAAALVPYSAAAMLASMLALPFVAGSIHPELPKSNVLRLTLGTVLAGLAFLVIHQLGPAIYRAIYPASFGDGMWLQLFAWGALAIIAASLIREKKASQVRIGIGAFVYAALLVGLTWAHGLTGLLLATSLGLAVSTLIGVRWKSNDPLVAE